jgi:hypothetical protein
MTTASAFARLPNKRFQLILEASSLNVYSSVAQDVVDTVRVPLELTECCSAIAYGQSTKGILAPSVAKDWPVAGSVDGQLS